MIWRPVEKPVRVYSIWNNLYAGAYKTGQKMQTRVEQMIELASGCFF